MNRCYRKRAVVDPSLPQSRNRLLCGIHPSDCFQAPATGYRLGETGGFTGVGTWGAYWCSSSHAAGNQHASHFCFGSDIVRTLFPTNRALALSVRCVQHLPEVALHDRGEPPEEGSLPKRGIPGTVGSRNSLVRLVRSMRNGSPHIVYYKDKPFFSKNQIFFALFSKIALSFRPNGNGKIPRAVRY